MDDANDTPKEFTSAERRTLRRATVCVTHPAFGEHDPDVRARLAATVGEVRYLGSNAPYSSGELSPLISEADGLIAGLDELDEAVFTAATRLKVVARYGVGTDNVDLTAAKLHDVTVTNTSGASTEAVAELAVGLTLSLARSIASEDTSVRRGEWRKPWGRQIQGSKVGVIGLGNIGRAFAERMTAFECSIIANDLEPDEEYARIRGIRLTGLSEILRESDILSLHVPLTEKTRDMVNLKLMRQMKPGALLINTARGDIVVEEDLVVALDEGYIGGAALDTLRREPPSRDNPLLRRDDVILTSHIGAMTPEASKTVGRRAASDVLAVLAGRPPRSPVALPKGGVAGAESQ